MMHDLIIGVAGSIIGSVIWVIGSNIYRYIKYYKDSEYSGIWMDTIPPTVEGAHEYSGHQVHIVRLLGNRLAIM